MTKKELVEVLDEKFKEVTKKDVEAMTNEIFTIIKEALAKGEKVSIAGFGIFETKDVPERTGVSKLGGVEKPWKKEAHKAPKFKPSKEFKEAVK